VAVFPGAVLRHAGWGVCGAVVQPLIWDPGRPAQAYEIVFCGADKGHVGEPADPIRFERSLPVTDAGHSGSLLAYAMNGEPLPLEHGYPMRLIVPGWYAVASVKWLTEIEVIGSPFTGFFQAKRYIYETRRDGIVACELLPPKMPGLPIGHERAASTTARARRSR
jgi:DMSO/TMAO reductase YedYZ molybdopterin-dependent catalytic subunit